ncbi:hypothetical protein BU26DRAFT_567149 [Trematosphaeria pertusa]|uniref:Uncharacterized protein n=1 Tax=Trematosphaeria pertusa TaxID=390896 RepID=A0A6A6I9R6_9PLEO|nr:uncharacterized protein BU26DRAFT_567149 [Trematosphaeria pertusa]KAF2246808.1 hypothetical protein BU26DRAFT_567149 [Trematosphaeria pertusa]
MPNPDADFLRIRDNISRSLTNLTTQIWSLADVDGDSTQASEIPPTPRLGPGRFDSGSPAIPPPTPRAAGREDANRGVERVLKRNEELQSEIAALRIQLQDAQARAGGGWDLSASACVEEEMARMPGAYPAEISPVEAGVEVARTETGPEIEEVDRRARRSGRVEEIARGKRRAKGRATRCEARV